MQGWAPQKLHNHNDTIENFTLSTLHRPLTQSRVSVTHKHTHVSCKKKPHKSHYRHIRWIIIAQMGVNESKKREVCSTNLSSRMYSISMATRQLYCTALPQRAESKKWIKTFSFAKQKSAQCFPDLPLSLFLLSSFSLPPSLSPLCTQECFVWSWDKRNKRHHWQKRLCAHLCVRECVCVWEWDCNYMSISVYVCVTVGVHVWFCMHVCAFVCNLEEGTIISAFVCVWDEWKEKRENGREEGREKEICDKRPSLVFWSEE